MLIIHWNVIHIQALYTDKLNRKIIIKRNVDLSSTVEKRYKLAYLDRAGSDQPVHLLRLIIIYTS